MAPWLPSGHGLKPINPGSSAISCACGRGHTLVGILQAWVWLLDACKSLVACFAIACDRPRPTQGLPGPSGPEPRKSPKRVRKEYPGVGSQKCPKRVSKESEKSPKRVRKSDFRLFPDSFETPGRTLWALLGPCPGTLSGLLSDSSGVPGTKGLGDPVWGEADRKP